MTPLNDPSIALVIIAPLVGAFTLPALWLGSRSVKAVGTYAFLTTLVTAYLATEVALHTYSSKEPLIYAFSGWPAPVGIIYEVDRYSALVALLIAYVMPFITLYSLGYIKPSGRTYLYYTLLLTTEVGMLGCVYTGDFFNLFVMLEVMSVSSYILVAYDRGDSVAVSSAIKYGIFGALATTIYFLAIVFAYGSAGTLCMADLALKVKGVAVPITGKGFGAVTYGALLFTVFMMWGLTFKAAIFPNHFWLPDAHSAAPSPISALLSGLVVNVGIYGLARFLITVLKWSWFNHLVLEVLLALGTVSAFIGSFGMLVQKDVKRVIAYSTIVNLGYVAIGYGLGTSLGATAATYHLITHSVSKALAFMSVGSLISLVGTREISRLRGSGRLVRSVGIPLTISLLSLGTIPPLAIFASKLILITAIVRAGIPPLAVAIIAPSILSFIAYMKVMYELCIKPPTKEVIERVSKLRVSTAEVVPVAILAATVVALGVLAPIILTKVVEPAVTSLMNTQVYTQAFKELATILAR